MPTIIVFIYRLIYISIISSLILLIPISAFSLDLLGMLQDGSENPDQFSSIKSVLHKKNLLIAFIPLSKSEYVEDISKILLNQKSKKLELFIINTEDFINDSECRKILAAKSINANVINGSKMPDWNSVLLFLETNNANVFLVDRSGKTHKYNLKTKTDSQTINNGIHKVLLAKKTHHKVRDGETLSTISFTYYGNGDRWLDIYRANRDQIRDPTLIYPGQILCVPLNSE